MFYPIITHFCLLGVLVSALFGDVPSSLAADPNNSPAAKSAGTSAAAADRSEAEGDEMRNPLNPSATLTRLVPEYDVWLDVKNKQVVLEGEVCLREGVLEMLACLKGTKEHESVIAVRTKAFVVQAALIALGAKPGTPVKYQPKYVPATGPKVDVKLFWKDKNGNMKRANGQDWVRNLSTKKPMEHPWIFSGSMFFKNPETGQERFGAEEGYLICVSNFTTAMLDLPVESSDSDEGLLFEAFTENIPPRGTKVTLVLIPTIPEKAGTTNESTDASNDASEDGTATLGKGPAADRETSAADKPAD